MIALYLFLFILGLIAVWLPIMLVATLFSGWWELARTYPPTTPAPTEDGSPIRRLQGSVYFSPIFRYQRLVHATVDADHLHLALPPIVGAFHKPMSIPWAEITFPRRDHAVLGMVPINIGSRRILVSRSFVKAELEIRSIADQQDEFDAFTSDFDQSDNHERHLEPDIPNNRKP